MDALATRAFVASSGDYYLCPLSRKQVRDGELASLIERGVRGAEALTEVFVKKGTKRELIATGYRLRGSVGSRCCRRASELG